MRNILHMTIITALMFGWLYHTNVQTTQQDSSESRSIVISDENNNQLYSGAELGGHYLEKAGRLLKTDTILPLITGALGTTPYGVELAYNF